MGFWKENWKKISADTLSGLFVRVIAGIILCVVAVVVAPKMISLPVDNEIAKALIDLAGKVVIYFYFIVIFFLPTFLNWLTERRQDKHRELELENENLKLKLELLQQEQESPRDEGE